jgi:ribosomal protein L29
MKKDSIKKLDTASLKRKAEKLKKELFDLKFTMAGGQAKDYSQFKKLRTNIARCLTFLNEKQRSGEK